jgi:hypothetical protein
LWTSLGCIRLKLWDPKNRMMVGFEGILEPQRRHLASVTGVEAERGTL